MINNKYEIKDRVLVTEIQRIGYIEAVQLDWLGLSYRVSYWDNSERKSVWLPENEITKV